MIVLGEWVEACAAEQLAEGQLFGFVHGDKKVLLANLHGEIHATDLVCTHAEADLSTGFLSGEGVRCPLHLSVFDLRDGRPQNPPAEEALGVYNVQTRQGRIWVEL